MIKKKQIELRLSDRQSIKLVNEAERAAKFILDHKEYRNFFVTIIRESSCWTIDTIPGYLKSHLDFIRNKRKKWAADDQYIETMQRLFSCCSVNADINDIRGIIPERILNEYYHRKYHGQLRTWIIGLGRIVIIDGKEINYYTEEGSKKTVDLAAWAYTLQAGEFVEAKVSPWSFFDVDAGYLDKLRKAFIVNGLDKCQVKIFTLDKISLLREKLVTMGYDFPVFSLDEIYADLENDFCIGV